MSFYRNILKQAWNLTWRNKYLWWFGIFAALLGNGGELEILFNNTRGNPGQALFPSWQRFADTGIFSWHTLANVGNLLKNDTLNMVLVLIAGLIVLAALLFLVWLVVVSQAAIVDSSAALLAGKKNTLKDGRTSGILNFWPVLVLNILIKGVVYVLLLVISLSVVFYPESFGAYLSYALAMVVAVPVVIILSFIAKYAIAYVIINQQKIDLAIKRGWQLFKENWLISFEMAVILFLINILVGLAMILAVLTLAVPFFFLALIFYYAFAVAGLWIILMLAFIGFLIIVIGVGAALSVFQITSWTSLFLELNKKRGASKLLRIVNSMIK